MTEDSEPLTNTYRVKAMVIYTITVEDTDIDSAETQAVQIPFSDWHLDHIEADAVAIDHDRSHGSPFDRGGADAYYRRPFKPHCFRATTQLISEDGMTEEEIEAYRAGFNETVAAGDFKDWG